MDDTPFIQDGDSVLEGLEGRTGLTRPSFGSPSLDVALRSENLVTRGSYIPI